MKQNEGNLDRLVRLLVAVLASVGGYFWLATPWQIVAYAIAALALITSITGFCGLYAILKINTNKHKFTNKIAISVVILLITVIGGVIVFASNFFSRKIFLEDFAYMNDSYKQLLFNSGKGNREESISYYEKLLPDYAQFQEKYTEYKPYALKKDGQLNDDLNTISTLLLSLKDAVYSGDLLVTHQKLEEVRPIFQTMFKRNGFSMLAVALVDFHDSMEEVIAGADAKDIEKIIAAYSMADTKLKEVEAELNDEGIQAIRKNLDNLLEMAKKNQLDGLSAQGAELKSSFVSVYLVKG